MPLFVDRDHRRAPSSLRAHRESPPARAIRQRPASVHRPRTRSSSSGSCSCSERRAACRSCRCKTHRIHPSQRRRCELLAARRWSRASSLRCCCRLDIALCMRSCSTSHPRNAAARTADRCCTSCFALPLARPVATHAVDATVARAGAIGRARGSGASRLRAPGRRFVENSRPPGTPEAAEKF